MSREADLVLKRILDRSRRSTAMVRAIAKATDEQARGSRQVTEAIHRMTETVQQIAAAAAQQARGSEQVQRAAEQTRALTGQVERGTRAQAEGGPAGALGGVAPGDARGHGGGRRAEDRWTPRRCVTSAARPGWRARRGDPLGGVYGAVKSPLATGDPAVAARAPAGGDAGDGGLRGRASSTQWLSIAHHGATAWSSGGRW